MCRAFTTRYAGPTNTRGARIIVRSIAGSRAIAWDYVIDPYPNHEAAARAAARSQGMDLPTSDDDVPSGELPDGSGYVFLFAI